MEEEKLYERKYGGIMNEGVSEPWRRGYYAVLSHTVPKGWRAEMYGGLGSSGLIYFKV